MSHPFSHLASQLGGMALHAIDKMSVGKIAVVGGAGSVFSFASAAAAPELATINAYLKTATLGVGLAVGLAALGVMALKAGLLWKHRHTPPQI